MKKIFCLLTVMIFGLILSGCNSGKEVGYTKKQLTGNDIVWQVKQAYVDRFLKEEYPEASLTDVKVTRYLGIYNGSYVAILNDNFNKYFEEYVIELKYEGFDFSYSNGYPIRVWNSGEFYDIVCAFEKHLLTKEDLQTIASLYNNEEDVKMVDEVKLSYLNSIIKVKRQDATIDDVVIMDYLGTYNGNFVAVFYDKQDCTFVDRLKPYEIAGMDFSYSEGYPIRVWKNGIFHLLHEVYSKGEITKNDLETIHQLYQNKHLQSKISQFNLKGG